MRLGANLNTQSDTQDSDSESTQEPEREFVARLTEAIGQGSVSAFAKRCGVSDPLMRKYLAGAQPGLDNLVKIAKASGRSIDWLVGTDGATKDASRSFGLKRGVEALFAPREFDDFQRVPLLDIRAAAGAGAWNDDSRVSSYLAFRRDWLSEYAGRDLSAVALVTVNGDSMEPTLPSGCVVMIRPLLFDGAVNGISLVQVNGMLVIKRVQTLAQVWREDNGCDIHLSLNSDNKAYAPIETWITKENEHETKVLGSAVWFGARLR
jgi:phage repressor protein C with HTH and peptisase S24 domain